MPPFCSALPPLLVCVRGMTIGVFLSGFSRNCLDDLGCAALHGSQQPPDLKEALFQVMASTSHTTTASGREGGVL